MTTEQDTALAALERLALLAVPIGGPGELAPKIVASLAATIRDALTRDGAGEAARVAALRAMVDCAITDSDTCVYCCADTSRHLSGCPVLAALAALETPAPTTPGSDGGE